MGTGPEEKHILLVEDTESLNSLYKRYFERQGFVVNAVLSGYEALDQIHKENFDLLILDVHLPDIDGLDLLTQMREAGFDSPVIVITGYGSVNVAVQSMRAGAADFLIKPFNIDKLGAAVEKASKAYGLSTKAILVEDTERQPVDTAAAPSPTEKIPAEEDRKEKKGFAGFIGFSRPMRLVYDIIENAAPSKATIFITGASGTGKEICAESIHKYSPRAQHPFVAVNSAAIPRDLIESELFGHVKGAFTGAISDRVGAVTRAHGGTLFLDEICEMNMDMQSKLLRFLQNLSFQKVGSNKMEIADVRIVCATNKNPLKEVRAGRFRGDLYYRLHVVPIHMPSLQERESDILDLADFFLQHYAREEKKNFDGFSEEAEKALQAYDWPGNVRELQNIIHNIVVLQQGQRIEKSMLPNEINGNRNPQSEPRIDIARAENILNLAPHTTPSDNPLSIPPLWQIEKDVIEKAIDLCGGNIPKAAAMLEISPSTIYRKKLGWEEGNLTTADHKTP